MIYTASKPLHEFQISIPDDDLLGKVIGREGRNTRLIVKLCFVNSLFASLNCDKMYLAIAGESLESARRVATGLSELFEIRRVHPFAIEKVFREAGLQWR